MTNNFGVASKLKEDRSVDVTRHAARESARLLYALHIEKYTACALAQIRNNRSLSANKTKSKNNLCSSYKQKFTNGVNLCSWTTGAERWKPRYCHLTISNCNSDMDAHATHLWVHAKETKPRKSSKIENEPSWRWSFFQYRNLVTNCTDRIFCTKKATWLLIKSG